MKSRGQWLLALGTLALAGCPAAQRPPGPPATPPSAPPSAVQFVDTTAAAGIHFVHNSGASGQNLIPEVMGSGAAFIDFDGDGYQDLFLVNGCDWTAAQMRAVQAKVPGAHLPSPPKRRRRDGTCALYRNNGDGSFTDVTLQAGLNIEIYGMGVAVGDYDNDGRPDLYVTGLSRNYLFHNETTAAGVKFRDVTEAASVRDAGWSTSAAWVDYDRDGKLDLFVCHYIQWTPATNIRTTAAGVFKSYIGPVPYRGQPNRLYHNLGGGRFEDVSERAGIAPGRSSREDTARRLVGKSLGVALCDFNRDGWPDLVVTNDTQPNFLFRNNKNGTFSEVGVETNIAYNEAGKSRAGMGTAVGDVDNSGRDTVAIGNFSLEMLGLYQLRNGLFMDIAPHMAVGQASLEFLTFGCTFVDYDNDGWLDLIAANGHVDHDIKTTHPDIGYAERPLVLHNLGQGHFREVGLSSGTTLAKPMVARGVLAADLDLDGDEDLLFTTNDGAPLLLRNDGGNRNHALRLILEGSRSNRSAIGTVIEAQIGGQTLRRMVRSGSSYLSQSELPVMLGLAQRQRLDRLTLRWPSGTVSKFGPLEANQILWINEDRGITKRVKLPYLPARSRHDAGATATPRANTSTRP